jgi:uncharacterized protein
MIKTIRLLILFTLGVVVLLNNSEAQNQTQNNLFNKWGGQLNIGKEKSIMIVFRLWQENDSIKASMDSPDQGIKNIPADSVVIKDNVVFISIKSFTLSFKGSFNEKDTSLFGTFSQGTFNQDMLLKPYKVNRPQEPKKPYPYKETEVTFVNGGITLAGTITMPEGNGPFTALVLISGSGPQDRNEEIFEHKPFMVIADYLTRNGYAVLRYDDRGTAKSTGNYKTAGMEDFAGDAFAAYEFLKKYPGVEPLKTGLLGHSEGGMIAPLLASKHPDIAFVIMMAGPGVRGDELLLLQSELVYKSAKIPLSAIKSDQETKKKVFTVIFSEKDTAKLHVKIKKIYSEINESDLLQLGINKSQIDLVVKQYISSEMLSIIRYDPCPVLKKVKCPVLAMNGDKDQQVPSKQNLKTVQTCLTEGGNNKVTIKELWYLNHLFQSATTGDISEYYEIEETVSPVALEVMSEWLNENFKKK